MNLSYVAKLPTASSNLNHRFKFIRFGPWTVLEVWTFLVLILGSSIDLHLIHYADLWINLMPIGGQLRDEALNLNLKLPTLDIETKGSTLTILQTTVETSDQILIFLNHPWLYIPSILPVYILSKLFNVWFKGDRIDRNMPDLHTEQMTSLWFFKNIITHC